MGSLVNQKWVKGQASIELVIDTNDPLTPAQIKQVQDVVVEIESLLLNLNPRTTVTGSP
jgi:hypothetical protein